MTYIIKKMDAKFRVLDGPICSSEHDTEEEAQISVGLLQRMDALHQDLEPLMDEVLKRQNQIDELAKQWLALGKEKKS